MKNTFFLLALVIPFSAFAQRTERDYWLETQFSFDQVIGTSLTDTGCYQEERAYRGCLSSLFAGLRHLPNPEQGSGVLPGNGGVLPGFKIVSSVTPAAYRASAIQSWSEVQPPRLRPSFNAAVTALKALLPQAELPWVTGNMANAYLGIAIDPHTYFMPTALNDMVSQSSHTTGLFGLSFTISDNLMVITEVMAGSSAVGQVVPGDVVLSINGVSGTANEMYRVMMAADSIALVLENIDGQRTVQVTRRQLVSNNVESKMLMSPADKKIGYIKLASYMSVDSCRDIKRAGEALIRQGAQSIILDLRDNGGGLVNQGSCIIGLFVEDNSLVWRMFLTHGNNGEEMRRPSNMPRLFQNIPSVTLVNGHSASASELTAGYLQAYGKSYIVGERSFGKGTMQSVGGTRGNSRVLMATTAAMFYGPNAVSPQVIGVTPDFVAYPSVDQTEDSPYEREGDRFAEAIENNVTVPVNAVLQQRKAVVQGCLERDDAVAKEVADANIYERRVIDPQLLTAKAVLDCHQSERIQVYRDINIPALRMPGQMRQVVMQLPRSW